MDDKTLFLEILTPEKTLFKGKVLSVQLPGITGPFTVLFNHAPLVSLLTQGHVRIIDKNHDKHTYKIDEGIVNVKDNSVVILTQTSL